MAKIKTIETAGEARLSLRALKATRSKVEPLLTSTEKRYRDEAQLKITTIDKKIADLVQRFPEIQQSQAAKKPVRDELTGKIEVDRQLVLQRLQACDDAIMAEVARIFASHASRKALEAAQAVITGAGEVESESEGEPQQQTDGGAILMLPAPTVETTEIQGDVEDGLVIEGTSEVVDEIEQPAPAAPERAPSRRERREARRRAA
ncbi:MAG: hypothetical protein RJA36_1423 [Pseudomonadota bacterium]|jgi:hypothetical protein